MAKYVQSTMSAGLDVRIYKKDNGSPIKQVLKTIHINGGANVRDKNSIFTPNGAMTEVSDEDFELLMKDHTFKEMLKNKYIVVTGDHHQNTSENAPKDKSAQKTPEYYEKVRKGKENPVPTTDPLSPEA